MTQLAFNMESIPIARKTDPESSHEAAARITDSGKRKRQIDEALARVRRHPGKTSLELSDMELDRYILARRLPELEKLGLVTTTENKAGLRWWPA